MGWLTISQHGTFFSAFLLYDKESAPCIQAAECCWQRPFRSILGEIRIGMESHWTARQCWVASSDGVGSTFRQRAI